MEYGLIGEHLGHSWSKEIHQMLAQMLLSDSSDLSRDASGSGKGFSAEICKALSQYIYELKEIGRSALPDFLNMRDFKAVNVTIPYKESVMPFLSSFSEQARSIGAVNVILNRNGGLIGHNTDFYGFQMLSKHAGISFEGKRVLILGAGGASKAVRAVAACSGARAAVHAVRHLPSCSKDAVARNISYLPDCDLQLKNGFLLYGELEDEYDVIVNTTPVGMYPNSADRILDLEKFSSVQGVLDCIYNPVETILVSDARKRGIPAEGGLYMLVAQAVKAFELFLDLKVDCNRCTNAVYDALLKRLG